MLITVLTPAYNRAHLLNRLFRSLEEQSCKDFEWLIVDDGSTDDTEDLCRSLKTNCFSVRYIKKTNGGKHTAINEGILFAQGELTLILDSDDSLPPYAVEVIRQQYAMIRNRGDFGGIVGRMAHHDGTLIGSECEPNIIEANSLELRYCYHVKGDMAEVFKTDVLREFTFPDIPGERFCPEALLWNRIAQKYRLRYFKTIIYFRDYLDGGLTSNIVKVRMQSPVASMLCYQELTTYNVPVMVKIKAAVNYWRFRLCANRESARPSLRWYWNWTMPLGYLMHLRDKLKVEN